MIVSLNKAEQAFVREMAEVRCMFKKSSKRVSNHSDLRVVTMGIAGEMAMAKGLGCMFNPCTHRGGDGHRRDLWRGDVTLSVKTRHKHLPAHFLYPTGQVPKSFHDDYAVIGKWIVPYSTLDIIGYCTKEDMNRYVTTIAVSGTRSGQPELRVGVPFFRFRDIGPLIDRLQEIEDEKVHLAQTQGYERYQWCGNSGRGVSVQ